MQDNEHPRNDNGYSGHSQMEQYLNQQWYGQPQFSVRDTYHPIMNHQPYGYPLESFANDDHLYRNSDYTNNMNQELIDSYDHTGMNDTTAADYPYLQQTPISLPTDANPKHQYDFTDMQSSMMNDGMDIQSGLYNQGR